MIVLAPELKKIFPENKIGFNQLMALEGENFRALEGRKTQRVLINNQAYFIKQHQGVGWKEIFKNIFQLKWPVFSAKNEWIALKKLQQLGIAAPEVIGYGCEGNNPATQRSFIITRELPPHISLEALVLKWRETPPSFQFKFSLIKKIAEIARVLHQNGINHRDFYLCHFLWDIELLKSKKTILYLIDLHRAQVRKRVPVRWLIKDLAGLYFSSLGIDLTQRDYFRFMKMYRQADLNSILRIEKYFWKAIKKRGDKLYCKHRG